MSSIRVATLVQTVSENEKTVQNIEVHASNEACLVVVAILLACIKRGIKK